MINFGVGVAVGVGLGFIMPPPLAFGISMFASGILTGKLSGQRWGATMANAGINAGFAMAGFGAGLGTSFIISRFAYSYTSYTVAHVIAGLGAAAIFGGGTYPVYKAGGERWLSAYLSFAGGFDAGLVTGFVYNKAGLSDRFSKPTVKMGEPVGFLDDETMGAKFVSNNNVTAYCDENGLTISRLAGKDFESMGGLQKGSFLSVGRMNASWIIYHLDP